MLYAGVPMAPATPQWSPPLRGGSTRPTGLTGATDDAWPQWSPPLRGGSTLTAGATVSGTDDAAMEPAVERREHVRRYCGICRDTHGRNGARR